MMKLCAACAWSLINYNPAPFRRLLIHFKEFVNLKENFHFLINIYCLLINIY